ncbi:MAG: N-6 DNA methylase [Candidatus Lokiarchaeota archaeon]|nr:N-6 DNA methylase [Candidatus Lokiarchaeota archaeon]MBD3200126.1 N-6 DNA methylase [Candidatus Lokiarchaeota archaeon]
MKSDLNGKELGLIKTPKKTANYLISKLGRINKNDKILDPCVGPGIFVTQLLERNISPSQIYAFDLNNAFKEDLEKLDINFEIKDTLLDFDKNDHGQFDFIIGNPPYLNKSSKYIRNNRNKLKKLYGDINAHETYSMFIVNSIWRLKQGGTLSFITSDSFLTLKTHKKLRKFLLEHCLIEELLLAPSDLFLSQEVSTSPIIIVLRKRIGNHNRTERLNNVMRIIPRIGNENQYEYPPKIIQFEQNKYNLLPFNVFFTDIEQEIIDLFEKTPKMKDYIRGYIGMHTHNNRKYIAAIEGTELSNIFEKRNEKIEDPAKIYKVIPRELLELEQWKPYLKRGGQDQYYRPIIEALDWRVESIPIYDIPNNAPFEEEGIVISGVSSRLAARYMPEGCYWDSNKAMGFIIKDNRLSIEYVLGLLNSSLYNYLAKGIINNTNSIQLTGLHSLPIILPEKETKKIIEKLVCNVISEKKKNIDYDYSRQQKEIDNLVFNFYSSEFNFPNKIKKKLDRNYSIY